VTPDRETTYCSCCCGLGVRYDFIVLYAERPSESDLDDFVQRLALADQAAVLSRLRHVHR
jgi:hypothetical protein